MSQNVTILLTMKKFMPIFFILTSSGLFALGLLFTPIKYSAKPLRTLTSISEIGKPKEITARSFKGFSYGKYYSEQKYDLIGTTRYFLKLNQNIYPKVQLGSTISKNVSSSFSEIT